MGIFDPHRERFALNTVMQNEFDLMYGRVIVNESIRSVLTSTKAIITAAILLGIVDTTYTFPRLGQIKDDITRKLQAKTPVQVQEIEKKVIKFQDTPKVKQLLKKAEESWKNYKPLTPKDTGAKPMVQPTPKTVQPNPNKAEEFIKKAMKNIWNDEIGGANINYRKIYKDSKGYNTIGVGHLVLPQELPLYAGKTLSDQEVLELFKKDSAKKLKLTKSLFPLFDQYEDDVKVALLNGVFRGDMSGSPNTVRLINQGQWSKAAAEYLDNIEYRDAVKSGSGVAKRMERNAKVIAGAVPIQTNKSTISSQMNK